jgi:hypothetical protein
MSPSEEKARNLILQLPGVIPRPYHGPYDFLFGPLKIEWKHKNLQDIRYSVGYTLQYQWGGISKKDFDYLLLSGYDGEKFDLWLLDAWTARCQFLTKYGQISFTPYGQRWHSKSYELEALRLNYEQLHARFQTGKLS